MINFMPRTLIVSNYGSFIGLFSERVVVKQNNEMINETPLFRIDELIIGKKGVSISSDLINEAVKRGIRISFMDNTGMPYAMLTSPHLTAVNKHRRAQIEAFNTSVGFNFAKNIVCGKIKNQINIIKYFGKYIKGKDKDFYNELESILNSIEEIYPKVKRLEGKNINDKRQELLGYEGSSSTQYWNAFSIILKKEGFQKRVHQGAEDVINCALNYGYGILYSRVWSAVLLAGLEPYAGFIHTDRPGKPSLVLDLIEEFRQPIVDRSVLAMINKGTKLELANNLLTPESRKIVAKAILERLEENVVYKKMNYSLNSIIQLKSREAAKAFYGKEEYKPYRFKW
jgi:CRISPR-associated protein Cas1